MRKHYHSILLILIPALFVSVRTCPAAKADHRVLSYHYQPTPEQRAHDQEIGRWVQRAEKLLDQNDLSGARQAAEKALWIAGSHKDEFADEIAPVYLRTEQYERVVLLFGPHPDLGRNLSLNQAIALVKMGRFADARKCWRESQMLPYHKEFIPYLPGLSRAKAFEATVFLCRGIADVDQHHPMNGIWALHHALQLIPNNPLALWYYAEASANAGRPGEARRFFRAAIQRDHGLVARRARAGMIRLGP